LPDVPDRESAGERDPRVGCCSICSRASTVTSAQGSRFWRCGRSELDPAFPRYPTLPVDECAGFERVSPKRGRPRPTDD